MISRRNFLTQTAATCGGLALATTTSMAKIRLGNTTIRTISDGNLILPASFLFSKMPQKQLSPILSEYGITGDQLAPACNITLLQDGQNTVLFDVGSGADFMPSAGALLENLDDIGVSPEDITHVVFTHAHPDHIWGLLDDFDDPAFPNASYLMGRKEWDFWWNPETVDAMPDATKAFAVGAKRRMEAIEDAVELFDPDQEILPGIFAQAAYGHTPGHMAFEIGDAGQRALLVGDAIGNHHVAFHRPDWASGSDQDATLASQSRHQLLDQAAHEQTPIIGFHLPQGGIGRVSASDDGFRFVPEEA